MGRTAWLAILSLSTFLPHAQARPEKTAAEADALRDRIAYYDQRYGLEDPFQKRTNNHGEGFESLYGTRNFRTILNGIAYRGGANNKWNRSGRRENQNPLPEEGLVNLCREGFERSYYLYRTNYETAPKKTVCKALSGDSGALDYRQASPFDEENAYSILKDVHDTIADEARGPVYLHCWNGWHASGLIAAKILRQFCGLSADEAVAYWDRNTDGHNDEPIYESIRRRIRAFEPYPELAISHTEAERICP